MLTISKFFIQFSVAIIGFIKNIILKILSIIICPIKLILKFIKKIFIKPFRFIIINIRGFLSEKVEKLKKAKKNIINNKKTTKNAVQKKDFTI